MKQKKLFVLVTMILAVMFLSTGFATARPIELSLGLITPPTHLRNTNVIQPWMKMIEKKTQGKVKITPYYAGALAPPPESFNSSEY